MSAPSEGVPAARLTLVSHVLCPYVQRAAIVLAEKGVAFDRRDIDLADKPAWFLAVSPLGKTPVLLVGASPVFESAVICEYLDEAFGPRLHPDDALQRARERGWMEFGSQVLNAIRAFYTAPDDAALDEQRAALRLQFERIESALDAQGPWFAGTRFGLVDAVFAPVFRYFAVFASLGEAGMFEGLVRVARWRQALAQRPSVRAAVAPDYPQRLLRFVQQQSGALGRRMAVA